MTRRVFTGGQVLDGTGSPPARADVVVEGGRVVEVGPGLDGDEAVDCAGATVLPGLFDCHVHVMISGVDTLRQLQTPFSYPFYEAVRNLRRTLALGITTSATRAAPTSGWPRRCAAAWSPGPRMQIAVSMLSQTGGHGDGWHVCGAELPRHGPAPGPAGHRGRRRRTRCGGRCASCCGPGPTSSRCATSGGVLSPGRPAARALPAGRARRPGRGGRAAGVFVMAHAQGTDGIKNAVRAGVRSIEHGIFLDDEAIDLMLEHGTWLVPTLVAPAGGARGGRGRCARCPTAVVRKARDVQSAHARSVTEPSRPACRSRWAPTPASARTATTSSELALMAGCGMSPDEVWRSTTLGAAELLGVDREFGSLEPGKRADVVVLDGDPHDLTGLAGRVREVWRDGELVAAGGQAVDPGVRRA